MAPASTRRLHDRQVARLVKEVARVSPLNGVDHQAPVMDDDAGHEGRLRDGRFSDREADIPKETDDVFSNDVAGYRVHRVRSERQYNGTGRCRPAA
jgi:hypothetical protein